ERETQHQSHHQRKPVGPEHRRGTAPELNEGGARHLLHDSPPHASAPSRSWRPVKCTNTSSSVACRVDRPSIAISRAENNSSKRGKARCTELTVSVTRS